MPEQGEIDTRWRHPHFLASRRFTDQVVADQLFGCLSLVATDADEDATARVARLQQLIDAAVDAGLGPWVMEDLFTLSSAVAEVSGGCPHQTSTWLDISENLRTLFRRFPDLEGIIFRFGESFTPDKWMKRIDPFACECKICQKMGGIGALQRIIRELEEFVCGQLDRYCIIRMWDLGDEGFHADEGQQSAALAAWNGNTKLVVSVKHTATDYWRYQPWNPTIEVIGPPRLIEFQCEREYEFVGHIPNWLGHSFAAGFSEVDDEGRAGLANSTPPDWLGSYIIPKGGGWSATGPTEDFWSEMNASAVVALTEDPRRNADGILDAFLLDSGFHDESGRLSFATLVKMSDDLILNLRYLPTFQDLTGQTWMPSHNWFRDDNFVPGACAHIANTITEAGQSDGLRGDRAFASIIARTQLGRALSLFDGGPFSSHPKAQFILQSYHFAADFANLTEIMWDRILCAASNSSEPLSRIDAKRTIVALLGENPLPPLKCMD